MKLVHTEQSFKNAKANLSSASTSAAVESESEDHNFTDVELEEEGEEDAEWINTPYFPVEHVLEKYRSQVKKAIKEPVVEEPHTRSFHQLF